MLWNRCSVEVCPDGQQVSLRLEFDPLLQAADQLVVGKIHFYQVASRGIHPPSLILSHLSGPLPRFSTTKGRFSATKKALPLFWPSTTQCVVRI